MTGTLGDLKQRVLDETTRDDLSDELLGGFNRVIADAIDHFAIERWWFTEARPTSTCTIGSEYQALPSGLRQLDRPFLVVGNVRYDLAKRSMEEIEGLYATPITGQPTDFAVFGSNIRVWPTPGLAYSLVWLDVADAAALDYSDDTSSNVWTLYGQRLIAAYAKYLLLRDYLSATETDPRILLAQKQHEDAYSDLKTETNRRLGTGRMRAAW